MILVMYFKDCLNFQEEMRIKKMQGNLSKIEASKFMKNKD